MMKTNFKKPGAWIVSSSDKGRKSIKNGNVYLKNGEEFEIELFNPLEVSVLADIKINGSSISDGGLVIRPGQRVYLDCFVDSRMKFKFNTYEVENSDEVKEAIKNNGLVEVLFYKEKVKKVKTRSICNYKGSDYFNVLPMYSSTNLNCSTGALYSKDLGLGMCSTSYNVNYSDTFDDVSFETGRVESGDKSNQNFITVNMDFESYTVSTTTIQLLPDSRKPKENNIDKESAIELIKKLSELYNCGILTDEEFSKKKTELLDKI